MCLVSLGRYNNTMVWVAYEQQIFFFFLTTRKQGSPRARGQQISCPVSLHDSYEPDSWFIDSGLLPVSFKGRRGERALWGHFCKSTDLIHDGSALMTYSPPKGPTSKCYHVGDQVSTYKFGGMKTFCLQQTNSKKKEDLRYKKHQQLSMSQK